ncbi:MAG: hypothetical protein K0R12_784 [Gammaproteobacteria bacterium]|jgi:hypothetical protein|nr:hypothetical protein [Gammaproteobacteria bacterium]
MKNQPNPVHNLNPNNSGSSQGELGIQALSVEERTKNSELFSKILKHYELYKHSIKYQKPDSNKSNNEKNVNLLHSLFDSYLTERLLHIKQEAIDASNSAFQSWKDIDYDNCLEILKSFKDFITQLQEQELPGETQKAMLSMLDNVRSHLISIKEKQSLNSTPSIFRFFSRDSGNSKIDMALKQKKEAEQKQKEAQILKQQALEKQQKEAEENQRNQLEEEKKQLRKLLKFVTENPNSISGFEKAGLITVKNYAYSKGLGEVKSRTEYWQVNANKTSQDYYKDSLLELSALEKHIVKLNEQHKLSQQDARDMLTVLKQIKTTIQTAKAASEKADRQHQIEAAKGYFFIKFGSPRYYKKQERDAFIEARKIADFLSEETLTLPQLSTIHNFVNKKEFLNCCMQSPHEFVLSEINVNDRTTGRHDAQFVLTLIAKKAKEIETDLLSTSNSEGYSSLSL